MGESFESKLIAASSRDVFRKAKQILHAGELLCCHENSPGILRALFRNSRGFIHRTEFRGFPNGPYSFECNCDQEWPGFCPHAMAAALHHSKYTIKYRPEEEGKEAPALYAGLKFSGLPELLTQALTPSTAFVSIDAESEFPHVPSKWERVPLTVSLKMGTRQYGGNLNNLRQLHFGKSLAATLQLTAFPQQDRQIIRFLAINGEAENSQILLNAELTAEFFHCLINFPRFIREGKRLQIRGDAAEAVLLKQENRGGVRLSPGIRVEGAALPIAGAKVITGRSGCWVGREGEYFFVPATCEISWLRNFFRSSVQTPPEGTSVEEFLRSFPLPVVPVGSFELETREAGILLNGSFPEPDTFHLTVDFLYESNGRHVLEKPGSSYLVREGNHFWKRDEAMEHEFEIDAVSGTILSRDTESIYD